MVLCRKGLAPKGLEGEGVHARHDALRMARGPVAHGPMAPWPHDPMALNWRRRLGLQVLRGKGVRGLRV